jgi:hypothetical protein
MLPIIDVEQIPAFSIVYCKGSFLSPLFLPLMLEAEVIDDMFLSDD